MPMKAMWTGLVYAAVMATGMPAQTITPLVSFSGTNGNGPAAPLIQGADGNLYGTTTGGGTSAACGSAGCGTVFKLTPSGELTTIYNFCKKTDCVDGIAPSGGLVQAKNGDLYGTTAFGGTHLFGTVYKITPAGKLTTLYSFCKKANCADGSEPMAGLVALSNGNLYGTTAYGGATGDLNYGTVFEITPAGTLTTLYSFCAQSECTDGRQPQAPLIEVKGNLYGTTEFGGANGNFGTVFAITLKGALTTLYSFCPNLGCADGQMPVAPLVAVANGTLYGTTELGGANSRGTVFSIAPEGGFSTLHSFCSQANCADGSSPEAGLVEDSSGNLYGTTFYGGTSANCTDGCGTIFEMTATGVLSTLSSFDSQNGGYPGAALIAIGGDFYGSTVVGGTDNDGTVFQFIP